MAGLFPKVKDVSDVAMNILKKRYFGPGETTWEQLTDRVIDYVLLDAPSEQRENTREMMLNRYFIPNSPCLVNAGKQNSGLNGCYVVDFPDTIEGIYKTKLDFALVARKGGGCGTTLSKIRPEGSKVNGSTHGYAGGPIKFADTISHDADALSQSGFRSMAIMFTMGVRHPDLIKFINAKEEEGKISNANISVVVDDEFMQKVESDETYWTEFQGIKYNEYKARDIFNMIVEGAWRNGEPAVLFKNRIDDSPYKYTGQEILSTNPCSEQPLPSNGVCTLGSFDVSKFLNKDKKLNVDLFEKAIRLSVRFLDEVLDKSAYPTKEIEEWVVKNRAIGIGVMGVADYFLMKEMAYGSDESVEELEKILTILNDVSEDESEKIGIEKGFPYYCQMLPKPRRNITTTTVAPTGTISLIGGCSSGIEPIFSEITIRNDKTGSYRFENDLANKPYFRCAVASNGATEVSWEEHIKILAAAQRHIHSGVSKTTNFPTHTHRETIAKAFILAWKSGVKGLAVYRNGSRKVEVLSPRNVKKNICPKCSSELLTFDGHKKCSNKECEYSE